jgi:protein tyrosine kinase
MAGRELLPLPLPVFRTARGLVENSTVEFTAAQDIHCDLLSFLSVTQKLNVNMIKVTWQTGLDRLGTGASSAIQQAQIDKQLHMAFKRIVAPIEGTTIDTEQQDRERFRALTLEVVALETLRQHPYVVDLLGMTNETDPDSYQVWPVLLMERAEKGSMAHFLTSDEGQLLSAEEKLSLCRHIAQACKGMHELGMSFFR